MAMIFHPQLGNVRYAMAEVSEDPQEQVEQVIGIMRGYAVEDSHSPLVRADLERAFGGDGAGMTDVDKAAAIFHHVKSRISFTRDENTASPLQSLTATPIVEALIRPADMASMCDGGGCVRVGDCDDYAMYTASLLTAAGIPSSFVTVAADPRDPTRYSHVYVAAYPPSGRLALDVSHGDYPGWETGQVFDRREWPLTGGIVSRLLPWVLAGIAGWWVLKSRLWRSVWA